MAVLPPLELAVEVIDAGRVRTFWDPNSSDASKRPQNLSFSTKRGDGFADAQVTLSRRIDLDYVDLGLFDEVTFVGADGSIAYEGRVAALPRSFDQTHSITAQLAGFMAHARDRPFTEIFVDRDLSAWTPPSRARQAVLLTAGYGIYGFDVGRDVAGAASALILKIDGSWISPYLPVAEAVYDAGPGNAIANLYLSTEGSAGVVGNASWSLVASVGANDSAPDLTSADYWAGSDTSQYLTLTPKRFTTLTMQYTVTPGGASGQTYTIGARNLAVYGDHGLGFSGTVDPVGVVASDVIRYVAGNYCPQLDTSGIQDTYWPIPHLVFKEPTDPYDAFLAVNAFHLWELAVWENKTLTFKPSDRTDYDWEIRLSDFGVGVSLQGDSTEDLANGMIVEFTNVTTGAKDVLTPDVVTDLADNSSANPVTAHGLTRWGKITLRSPTTTDAATQIGKAALAEFNAPKAPGTINVTGHLRDRAGHWQQGWKVRAGDTIAITDHPYDAPRLITETSWNHDSKQLTVTVEGPAKRLDAVLDRVGLALTAGGLG